MEKKLTRTVRLTKLKEYLGLKTPSGGATICDLAEKCGVTPRQIYRDLDTLENSIEIKIIRPPKGQKENGRYRLDEAFSLKIGPEAAAIMFLSLLTQKGSPLTLRVNEIKDIIIAALFMNRYGNRSEEIEKLQSRVHVVENQLLDANKTGEVLLKLMEAIRDNKVVSIKYYTPSKSEWSTRDVEPYGLTSKHYTWYLIGHCRKNCENRTFRLDLIDHVFVLSQKFNYPEDFCLQGFFDDSWGIYCGDEKRKVLIKVSPELAYRFRLISYHPSQVLEEELEDGSVIVSYCTSGQMEFVGWLLQWGEFVEVLEPVELRKLMRQKMKDILNKYI